MNRFTFFSRVAALALVVPGVALAAPLTSQKEHFGFRIGDDYQLATFTQTEAYFKKLAAESDRLDYVDIGATEEGRRQPMLIASSPENLKHLARYKEISRKLARAEDLTDEQARALVAEGRAIVWIDGGLHATETVGTHQLIETIWQIASRNDPETLRILDRVIILFVHANPDGQEIVSNWYMRKAEAEQRKLTGLPVLYEKYIGHDNNRDFFMVNVRETNNLTRQLYLEWLPQVMYNHHQSGPAGAIIAGPPYRDPFNYVFDPLVITGIDALGAAMNNRFNVEGKPGATQRRGSVFSTWYNGGLRTTTYFHNMVGLLTEIVGNPTPMEIPLVPKRLLPSGDTPFPVTPQKWHFRQSIDYSISANFAVLDYAARNSDTLLFNIYRMGRNSIERGSGDFWTPYPKRIDAIIAAEKNEPKPAEAANGAKPPADDASGRLRAHPARGIPTKFYDEVMKKPEWRDARGYIIPANQPDFATAVKFINALLKTGIRVHRATAEFAVNGKNYPAGSYVVKTAQAFRPHVIDMFEPQNYPQDFEYEGGPPIPPYDSAGWTLAYQMDVRFDRVLESFDGPFAAIPYGELQSPPPAKIAGARPGTVAGFLVSHRELNSFILANRLLKAGAAVSWLENGVPGEGDFGPGTLFVPATATSRPIVEKAADELGVAATSVAARPGGRMRQLASPRIALWDTYGGSMPSGWLRWLLEQHEFGYDVIFPYQINAGDLRAKYDVIVLPTGAVAKPGARVKLPNERADGELKPEDVPEELRDRLAKIDGEKSVPQLRKFLEAGGTIIAIGSSTSLAYHLDLPLRDALVEIGRDGTEKALTNDKFYVPGSLLRATIDNAVPVAWGMPAEADVYFDNSPVFKLAPGAVARGLRPIAWLDGAEPLRSGWAWGQSRLKDGVLAVEAPVGAGTIFLFGPEITFRAQTHGTFKLFFNGLLLGGANPGS